MALQLQPNFDIKALKALVTPEVVSQAVNETEEKAAVLEAAKTLEGPESTSSGYYRISLWTCILVNSPQALIRIN